MVGKITTPEMECALALWFDYRVNLIVPNVHWGMNMHECDLLIVSKAGYVTEVEIKISRADLRADAKKWHGHQGGIAKRVIKYLYFAVPEDIIASGGVLKEDVMVMIPERAGILTVRPGEIDNVGPRIRRIREPTVNKHASKMPDSERYKVARLGALRIWNLKGVSRGR